MFPIQKYDKRISNQDLIHDFDLRRDRTCNLLIPHLRDVRSLRVVVKRLAIGPAGQVVFVGTGGGFEVYIGSLRMMECVDLGLDLGLMMRS